MDEIMISVLFNAFYADKNNKEVIMDAVMQNGRALEYASASVTNDKEYWMAAVTQHCIALWYASDIMKNDKEVVLVAVKHYGRALEYASVAMKNDKEVVMTAVAGHDTALEFASDALKNDKEVVMAAVSQNGIAFRYASAALFNDPIFALSMKMIHIRRRYRWPRLVKQLIKFEHDDKVFHALFHPALIEEQADEICNGGDDVGPQASTFWNAVMNKRRKLNM
jgi:hypothetical protein